MLITGGSGFIGSHLAAEYLAKGNSVSILDNISTGDISNLGSNFDRVNFTKGEIQDSDLVEDLVSKSDLVLHMAAALGVSNIMNRPLESISTNVLGSQVVLEAAAKYKKRILIASTSEIYGKNPNQPLSEEDDRVVGTPQNFRWSYSDAKALEESMASALFFQKKLQVTTVRFFNTVGPRQSGTYGMVLPRFVESALKNEEILIHGTGEQTRVFCHVYDAVQAITGLIANLGTVGKVYNVGGAGEISINQLAERVIALTNSRSSMRHIPYTDVYPHGFEDMQRRVPNISKIGREIGWFPSKSIDQIILDVAENLRKI